MVKNKLYLPDRGDIVWLDFTPQAGHEQRGRRPAIVISKASYNSKVGLALFCPITNQIKGYPFEIEIDLKKTKGCVLADQIKNLDWKERNIEFIEKAQIDIINEVLRKIRLLVD